MADLTDTIADGPLASEGYTLALTLDVSEAVNVSETWVLGLVPGLVVVETATASDVVTLSGALTSLVAPPALGKATEKWLVRRTLALMESVAAAEAWAAYVHPSLVERARASDAISVQAFYNLTQAQSAKATEGWAWSDGAGVGDSAAAAEAWGVQYAAGVQVVETGFAGDVFSPLRRAVVVVNEPGLAGDALSPQFNYSVSMVETAVANLAYMAPNGSVTAWAINTRTNAVTEYKNWSFNSFASMGRKYIAASPQGLYELNGASDDGQQVRACFGGGYFQPNGGKTAGLKGVYIGVGGQGQGSSVGTWLLKIVTGDGSARIYKSTSNPGLMTSKINVGKGLHARYYAWELQNADGQDFDFDSIEFVPMMSGRRVG